MKYTLIILIFIFTQCTNEQNVSTPSDFSNYDLTVDEDMEIEPPRTSESSKTKSFIGKENKIIQVGNLNLEVVNLKKTKLIIDKTIKELNAYYESENYLAYENGNNYKLKIRVPNSNFYSLISILESGKGELISKSINVKDVTEDFLDLNIRLENKLAYLNQYKLILKKAQTIKEILEVQEIIRRLETEIESKKGRMKFLNDQVKFSTLNLELTEFNSSKKIENRFINKIINALENGFNLLIDFIIKIINIWPFILLIIIFILFRKKIVKIIKR